MLETFRENARSWIIQVLIAAIAIVFIFSFGPGSQGCGPSTGNNVTWAAEVDGKTVPASSFQSAFEAQVAFQRRLRGGTYSLEDARNDDLRSKTMKEVVDRELIAQAGERQGLWVSDDEVRKEILDIAIFQKNGRFDPQTYRAYVENYEGISPAKFEERVRRELLAQRALELALGSVTVSEDEIRNEFAKSEEGASIAWVRFTPAQFKDQVEVTDADVEKVLAERMDDVRAKYDASRWKWLQPKGIRARRVFEPVAQGATAEEEAAAKKKVEDAAAALESGTAWEEVAKGFGEDPAAQGPAGEVGWVELGRSPHGRTFEEEVFKLEPGQRSGVVRDRFGFFVVEALEVRQATEKQLDDVKNEIGRELAAEQKAKDVAAAEAQQTLEKLAGGESLAAQWPAQEKEGETAGPAAAATAKPEAQETDEFHPYGGFIPGIGSAPKLSAAVFSLSADKKVPDAPVEDNDAFYVFELTSRSRADFSQLDDARKASLRERLVGQKKAELQRAWVEQLREKASIEENPQLLSYEVRQQAYGM